MSKHVLFSAATILMLVVFSQAQTNFYEQVKSMWFNGDKHGVLDIANQRLAINSNDIAGLLLKLEYEEEFLLLDNATNTVARIVEVGSTFSGTNFTHNFPLIETWNEMIGEIIANYLTNEYMADLAKTNIVGKTMSCDMHIKALQDDGYFQ